MTNTLLWTAFYVFIALVVLAAVVRLVKGLLHRKDLRGPHGRRPRE